MAGRKGDNDLTGPIAALTGVGLLTFVLVPGFRQIVLIIGWVALILLGVAICALALLGIFRLAIPERNMRRTNQNVFADTRRIPEQKPGATTSEPKPEPALSSEPIISLRGNRKMKKVQPLVSIDQR